jgi:hypothetical protein
MPPSLLLTWSTLDRNSRVARVSPFAYWTPPESAKVRPSFQYRSSGGVARQRGISVRRRGAETCTNAIAALRQIRELTVPRR